MLSLKKQAEQMNAWELGQVGENISKKCVRLKC